MSKTAWLVLLALIGSSSLQVDCASGAERPVHWVTWRQDPCHTLLISWITEASEKRNPRLWYQDERQEGSVTAWKEAVGSCSSFPFLDTVNVNQLELAGLEAGTVYRLAWGSAPKERGAFDARVSTAPDSPETPIQFVVLGDGYCEDFANGDVTATIARQAARLNPHFAIVPGNMAFGSGDEAALGRRWLEWLTVWSGVMKSRSGQTIPTLFAIGDHEVKGFDSQPISRAVSFFRLCPTTGIRGYTSLDFGADISLFLLDAGHTNPIESGQLKWLEASLAARQNRSHRIAAYQFSRSNFCRRETNEKVGAEATLRPWQSVFERCGMKTVFENGPGPQPSTAQKDRATVNTVLYLNRAALQHPTKETSPAQEPVQQECDIERHQFLAGKLFVDREEYQSISIDGRTINHWEVSVPEPSAKPGADSRNSTSTSVTYTGSQQSVAPESSTTVAETTSEPFVTDPVDQLRPDSKGIPIPPPRPNWTRRVATGRLLHVPADYSTIGAAVQAAEAGDTVLIGPGDYCEAVTIDKSISLVGSGPLETRLHALDRKLATSAAITVRRDCDVAISELTAGGGYRGIFVDPAGRLDLRHVYVLDNARDGVYMEHGKGDAHTYLYMERCLVSGTADGVDFMGGQGYLIDCAFCDNSDDGVDFDGDSGVVVYGCLFCNNRDDGIEVRLKQRTYIFAVENTFDHNGEDGFEVIDTFLPENGIYNIISLQNNRFYQNRRYGIGFVDQKTEKDGSKPVSSAVYIGQNEFLKPGQANVTDNYRNAVDLAAKTPEWTTVTIGEKQDAKVTEHKLITPLLVGIYDLKAMTDGTHCSDSEDVAVSSTRVYVPDDDKKMIYVFDRLNGDLLQKIPMTPIRGSKHLAKGPEGVHVIETAGADEKLWVSDDDGLAIYLLSLAPETYGQLLELQSTADLGPCEGIALLGDSMYVTRSHGLSIVPATAPSKARQRIVRLSSDLFGAHVAGVSVDSTGTRLFATTSGYSAHESPKVSWRGRDKPSGIYELTPDLKTVKNVWNLGPFCDDLRGVAYRDRLLYAACGRQPYTDPITGELVRNGEKVFVFVVDGDRELAGGHETEAVKNALKYLPLRCGH